MKQKACASIAIFIFLVLSFACSPDQPEVRNASPSQASSEPARAATTNANSAANDKQNDSLYSEIDNQMSVAELRRKLEEVKAIEREARRMVNLRQNWEFGVAECMRMMERLKPRAVNISDEYKRMLSPAGTYIASAAMNLIGCINCVERDDDDCSYARDFISKAERELKREERGARRK